MAQPRDPTAIPPEPIRERISYLRGHCEQYVSTDRGVFPTPEEQALLEVLDFVLGAPSNQRERVAERYRNRGAFDGWWPWQAAGSRRSVAPSDRCTCCRPASSVGPSRPTS